MAGALTRPRDELRRLTREILQRKARIGRDLYGVGVRLISIQARELWRADGYPSFEAYLAQAIDISRTHAYRFIRIAENFNAEIAARYGVTKLESALRYLATTSADEAPGDLLAAEIRIRDDDGRFRALSLHEATAAQIDEARRLLENGKRSRRRGSIPKAWQGRAANLEACLPKALPGTVRGRRVRLKRATDGGLAISFLGIPVAEIRAFLATLHENFPEPE